VRLMRRSPIRMLFLRSTIQPCDAMGRRLTTRSRQQPIALRSSFLFDWDYSVCR